MKALLHISEQIEDQKNNKSNPFQLGVNDWIEVYHHDSGYEYGYISLNNAMSGQFGFTNYEGKVRIGHQFSSVELLLDYINSKGRYKPVKVTIKIDII